MLIHHLLRSLLSPGLVDSSSNLVGMTDVWIVMRTCVITTADLVRLLVSVGCCASGWEMPRLDPAYKCCGPAVGMLTKGHMITICTVKLNSSLAACSIAESRRQGRDQTD